MVGHYPARVLNPLTYADLAIRKNLVARLYRFEMSQQVRPYDCSWHFPEELMAPERPASWG